MVKRPKLQSANPIAPSFPFPFHPHWLKKMLGAGLLGLSMLSAGCSGTASSDVPPTPLRLLPDMPMPGALTPTPTPIAQATPTPGPRTPQPPLISNVGIGTARLGMTYAELKQQVEGGTTFEVKSPFIVDFDAIAVSRSGKVQYYILYLAGTSFGDADVVQGLFTDNPAFKTAEGIGPGSLLKEAEAAYGKVTLSYNTQNESREFARFEQQPSPNISFATGNGNANPAGIYTSPTAEFNETRQYRDDATIESVLLVCLSENCAE